jgi:hypothetical protein
MSKFCGTCGAPITDGAKFCGGCGASTQQVTSPAPTPEFQPVPQPIAMPSTAPAMVTPAAKSSSPWLKILIVVLIVIFAVGAMAVGGAIYLAHKVSQKAQEYKREVLGETAPASSTASGDRTSAASAPRTDAATSPASSAAPSGFAGDACRLLSKEDVSNAVGIAIVDTASTDGGCSYFAKGKSVDMTAKHATAMVSAKANIDKKSQGMLEQFASAVGNSRPANEVSENDRADGTTVVFGFGIDTNNAEDQMRLNSKMLGFGGIGGIDTIDGIGDEAFSKADSMMFVRKGDKLIRIMYMTCPCATEAVKPLAKEIAANL